MTGVQTCALPISLKSAWAVENDADANLTKLASMAKEYGSRVAVDVANEALQIHGANGYQQGHPLESLYRRARGRRLAAGTDEIQKNQIAAELKKNGIPDLV